MAPINVSALNLVQIRGYREFFYEHCLAQATHQPYFSLDEAEKWMQPEALAVYRGLGDETTRVVGEDTRHKLEDLSFSKLKLFRNFLVPPQYEDDRYFSMDNAKHWFKDRVYEAWQDYLDGAPREAMVDHTQDINFGRFRGRSRSRSLRSGHSSSNPPSLRSRSSSLGSLYASDFPIPPSPSMSRASSQAASDCSCEVIELTDDEDDVVVPNTSSGTGSSRRKKTSEPSQPKAYRYNAQKRPVKVKSEPQDSNDLFEPIIVLSDSEDSEAPPKKIRLTNKVSISGVKTLKKPPSTWTVPQDNSAYLLDLEDVTIPSKAKGDGPMSIDAYIRSEDQDSWGGSSGHTKGDVDLPGNVFGVGEEKVRCRRVALSCNGVTVCEHFNKTVLEDCKRYIPDKAEMQSLWHQELEANDREINSVDAILARFYTLIVTAKCPKEGCNGKATLRKPLDPSSYRGPARNRKKHFVGCDAWNDSDGKGGRDHLYFAIPPPVDEATLEHLLKTGGVFPESSKVKGVHDGCALVIHPSTKRKTCPYTHITEGETGQQTAPADLVKRGCPTTMTIYVPVSMEIQKALVLIRNPHNHPMHPASKMNNEQKDVLLNVMRAAGAAGLTVQGLRNAPTTSALLEGKSLESHSSALADNRKLRRAVHAFKLDEHPEGFDWIGVQKEMEKQTRLPIEQRYIHATINTGDCRTVVTMLPKLAEHIHKVNALAIDFSFKRVHGVFNEWEIAGFLPQLNQRVAFASFYCDHATTEAFETLFGAFFKLIPKLTNRPLRFVAFSPEDEEARLKAILLDGEVAQAYGLGKCLVDYVNTFVKPKPAPLPDDPIELMLHVTKLCYVHFERNIDGLKEELSPEEISRLKGFRALASDEEIADFHEFCRGLTSPKAAAWYKHKLTYPWIFKTVNPFLSSMDTDHFVVTPNDTNLVEGAHSERNAFTGIKLSLVDAIQRAYEYDCKVADEIDNTLRNGVSRNRWNQAIIRESRGFSRQRTQYKRITERETGIADYKDLEALLDRLKKEKGDSQAREVRLKEEASRLRKEFKLSKDKKISEEIASYDTDRAKEQGVQRELRVEIQDVINRLKELKKTALFGVRMAKKSGNHSTTSDAGNPHPTTEDQGSRDSQPPELGSRIEVAEEELTGQLDFEPSPALVEPDGGLVDISQVESFAAEAHAPRVEFPELS